MTGRGAATYRIPVDVLPGPNGSAPQLALAYSSATGTGALGAGWSLEGQSRIHRCYHDLVRDAVAAPIFDEEDDRLCLEGQRLVAVDPAQYGKAGAEYRLEQNPNIKIVGNLSSTNEASSFTVRDSLGTVLRYGSSADSRVLAYGHPRTW